MSERRSCRQNRESVAMRNWLGTKEVINWRALKMAKHSVEKKEEVGGRLLGKEICNRGK